MNTTLTLEFSQPDLLEPLLALSAIELDALEFGVIGMDAETKVCDYNTLEAKLAGLSKERVMGHQLFTMVAPCMNNFMVANRFEEATAAGEALDVTLDYVLTLRMRPAKVKMRLLAGPGAGRRFVLIHRKP